MYDVTSINSFQLDALEALEQFSAFELVFLVDQAGLEQLKDYSQVLFGAEFLGFVQGLQQ